MLSDYYPSALRARAMAAHGAGISLGMFGGMVGGGVLLQTVGWRAGFLWLGCVGLLLALIFHLTVREPVRTDALKDGPIASKNLLSMLGDLQAFLMVVLALATLTLASAAMAWLPSYYDRTFALSPIQIGLGLGVCAGLASALGAFIGGQFSMRWQHGSRSWGARFSAIAMWLIVPIFVGVFFAPSPVLSFTLLFVVCVIAGSLYGPVGATLADLVSPHARATASALVLVVSVVIGQGLGPLLVGVLSDWFTTQGWGAQSVRFAMTFVALFDLLSGLFFWLLGRRIDVLTSQPAAT
jgi:predicted MFS family arabinose efflux permease